MWQLAFRKFEIGAMKPADFFAKVRSQNACLLESGQVVGGNSGQYSIIGWDPLLDLEKLNNELVVNCREANKTQFCEFADQGQKCLADLINQHHGVQGGEELEIPFVGGWLGYFSYDFGQKLMGINDLRSDDVVTADFKWAFFDQVVVFDHQQNQVIALALGQDVIEAAAKLKLVIAKIEEFLIVEPISQNIAGNVSDLESNLSLQEYRQQINEVKKLLVAGETYEVNFAHRFVGKSDLDGWDIYKKLAAANPSPYMCYFEGSELNPVQIISNSPERLVICRDNVLVTRPIKGTVPRGRTEAEDQCYQKQLLASRKDEAELNMIVDLARNDLGQIAKIGTVEVTEHRVIEKYSHVQHTMSNIRAVKREDVTFIDVVKAMFPGGSITGAPKKRTMEIIAKLEKNRRGIYCGSAGYLSVNGNFDLNILIRTVVCNKGEVCFHSGGAIVIDSEADEEWQETLDKAGAIIQALN